MPGSLGTNPRSDYPKNISVPNKPTVATLDTPCSCKAEHVNATHPPPTQTTRSSEYNRTIFVISPTYKRLTQKSDLTSVCITLMHVPNLVWIVVEDSDHKSDLVKRLLTHCKVISVHLNAVTPDYYKKDSWKPRGVLQRNAGLNWIREHNSAEKCNGVVYFGDDDNSYDLRLFEEVGTM